MFSKDEKDLVYKEIKRLKHELGNVSRERDFYKQYKDEYEKLILEVRGYKKKYKSLTEDMEHLKKEYQNELEKLISIMSENE